MQGNCTRGDACAHEHLVTLSFEGPTTGRGGAVRALAVCEQLCLIMYADGAVLHFVTYDAGAGAWKHLAALPQPGEIDTLHVAEPLGLDAGAPALLFVAFSCAVPAGADAAHAAGTAVPVGMLKMYDLVNREPATGSPRESFPLRAGSFVAHKQAIVAMDSTAASADVPLILVTGSLDGAIKLWRPASLPGPAPAPMPAWDAFNLESPSAHVRGVTSLSFIGAGGPAMRLLSGSDDRTVKVWSFAAGLHAPAVATILPPFAAAPAAPGGGGGGGGGAGAPAGGGGGRGLGRWARAAAASATPSDFTVACIDEVSRGGSSVILVGYSDGHVRAWSTANPDAPELIELPQYRLDPDGAKLTCMRALCLSSAPDAPVILTGYDDGRIVVRDLSTGLGAPVFTLHAPANAGHSQEVLDLVPCPGDVFVSAGADGRMLLWSLTPPVEA